MSETEFRVTWLTGVKELKPVEYRIETERTGRWWWRKPQYWIATDFGRLGPYVDYNEAQQMLAIADTQGRALSRAAVKGAGCRNVVHGHCCGSPASCSGPS
jgi:hypothetical protein